MTNLHEIYRQLYIRMGRLFRLTEVLERRQGKLFMISRPGDWDSLHEVDYDTGTPSTGWKYLGNGYWQCTKNIYTSKEVLTETELYIEGYAALHGIDVELLGVESRVEDVAARLQELEAELSNFSWRQEGF